MQQWDTVEHGLVRAVGNSLQTASGRELGVVYHLNGAWHGHAWNEGVDMRYRPHRVGGPAMYYIDLGAVIACWYLEGMYHRIEGPALFYHWYVEHRLIKRRGWQRRARRLRWLWGVAITF